MSAQSQSDPVVEPVEGTPEELRAAIEQKTVLLHEVEHRVKNNLQLISSLIQFQARRVADPDVRAALQEVQERVGAISTVHRRLFQSDDAGRFDVGLFLADLADDLVGRTGRDDLKTVLEADPVEAPAAQAAPLSLMVNEILGHTTKHGFPGRPGTIRVSLRRASGGAEIEISDDSDLVCGEVRDSLAGRTGILEILRRQLGAEVRWFDNDPGVRALISLPIGERR